MKAYEAVFFDFDGVLCHDHFYDKVFLAEQPEVCAWVNTHIFNDIELTRKWMRGQLSSCEINDYVASSIGMDQLELMEKFDESVRRMRLDERMVELVERLSLAGIKTGIVTDNMDAFSTITVPEKNLNDLFNVIINSSDHGCLKQDENGKVFDRALQALGVKIEKALHIDDSPKNIELFKDKGGQGFLYKNYGELKNFLEI